MPDSDTGLHSAVQRIEENTGKIAVSCARMEERLTAHMAQRDIHTAPPCDFQKAMDSRIWAALVTALGALIATVWGYLR